MIVYYFRPFQKLLVCVDKLVSVQSDVGCNDYFDNTAVAFIKLAFQISSSIVSLIIPFFQSRSKIRSSIWKNMFFKFWTDGEDLN